MTRTAREAFEAGLANGLTPRPPGGRVGPAGTVTTATTSWWSMLTCDTCGHTFRSDDRVVLDGTGRRVRHTDPALGCAATGTAESLEAQRAFANGLLRAFPPPGGVPVQLTDDVPRLLAPPRRGLQRPRCLVCAHTFRPVELVVICPCRPDQPMCLATVHRDPARGLLCLDVWLPGGRATMCPVTLRPLDRERP